MSGHEQSPENILTAHAAAVRQLARAIVRDPSLAEDVAQDSMLVALRRPSPAAWISWPWLAGVVRNVARNTARSERRRRARQAQAAGARPPAGEEAPLGHLERIEAQRAVVEAVAALPEPYRETITLHYFAGLTTKAVAERLGVPHETIRTRVRTGLKRLRQTFSAEHPYARRRMAGLIGLSHSPWSPPVGAVVAGAMMKKTICLAVATLLLVGFGTWWLVLRHSPGTAAPKIVDSPGSAADAPARLVGNGREPAEGPEVLPKTAHTRITGRVVEARTGSSLAGARVRALRADVADVLAPDALALAATHSLANGRFELGIMDAAAAYVLVADSGTHAPHWVWARPGGDVTIALDAPRRLRGHVRDIADQPIAGAIVKWRGILGAIRYERVARTAADGSYALAVPRVRGLDLISVLDVSAPGFAPLRVPATRIVPRGTDVELDLHLLSGATLHCIVIDAASRRPVANARVFVWSESEVMGVARFDGTQAMNPYYTQVLGTGRSDDAGAFVCNHVPPWSGAPVGVHTASRFSRRLGYVVATADGYVPRRIELEVPDEGQRISVELDLAPATEVIGRVVDVAGEPVADATVYWTWADGRSPGWVPGTVGVLLDGSATTDEQGRYRLPRVALVEEGGPPIAVHAHRSEPAWWHARARVDLATTSGAGTEAPDLVLPLQPEAPYRDLLVVTVAGEPVVGAYAEGGIASSRSDADGRLRVYFQPASTGNAAEATVRVQALGFAPSRVALLPELAPAEAVRVQLTPAAPAAEPATLPAVSPSAVVLEGALRGAESGTPILKHRTVLLDERGREAHRARYAGPGRFAFHDVPEGVWRLRATSPGHDPLTREVRVSAENPLPPLELRLTAGVSLRVCCKDEKGSPVRNARLTFRGKGGYFSGDLDAGGCTLLRGLKPGHEYEVTCSRMPASGTAEWFVPSPIEPVTVPQVASSDVLAVTLQRAGVTSIRIQSERLGLIEAAATPAQLEARAGTKAWLEDEAGRVLWQRSHLRGSGWSLFGPLGEFTLHIQVPGAEGVSRKLTLDANPGSRTVIEIE